MYRKETHTQRYLKWRSNHSKNCLLGIIKGLVHRAHYFCDLKKDLLDELDLLKDVFIMNGYPLKLVMRTIEDSWKTETKKTVMREMQQSFDEEEQKEEYFEVLHAPYIHGFTQRLQKKLKPFNIGFVHKKGDTIFQNVCHLKQKIMKDEKKNRIYSVPCQTCGKSYIGETGQQISRRIYQHQYDIHKKKATNGIFKHMEENPDHIISWENIAFVDQESNWSRRKINESIYINAMDPSQKPTQIMNLEKGKEVNPCWNEFNSVIKKIVMKKARI